MSLRGFQWSGAPKYRTTDYAECPWFVRGAAAGQLAAVVDFPAKYRGAARHATAFCAFGVALKRLVDHDRPPRGCGLRHRAAPGGKIWMPMLATVPPDPQLRLETA